MDLNSVNITQSDPSKTIHNIDFDFLKILYNIPELSNIRLFLDHLVWTRYSLKTNAVFGQLHNNCRKQWHSHIMYLS